jgi:predicted neutral ceramidase superfamily lipid hydrolase
MSGHQTVGTVSILPVWLAIVWALAFLVVLAVHERHALESTGQTRIWHCGHVVMAAGMAIMFVSSADSSVLPIPNASWAAVFAGLALAILIWCAAQVASRRAINALWLLAAVDMAMMAYMRVEASRTAALTWLLVASYCGVFVLWASGRGRSVDRRYVVGAYTITPDGAVAAGAGEALICDRDLRVSMGVMALGMAYMLASMAIV